MLLHLLNCKELLSNRLNFEDNGLVSDVNPSVDVFMSMLKIHTQTLMLLAFYAKAVLLRLRIKRRNNCS